MAVIQYTGIVNQIRGKLNGSVFNKSRNANTLQRKQQQAKGNKGFQQYSRQVFQRIQRSWKDATTAQKTDWQTAATNNPATDRFGQPTILSGYTQFLKANLLRSSGGAGVLFSPQTSTADPIAVSAVGITNVVFFIDGQGRRSVSLDLQQVITTLPVNTRGILEVSLPISRGVTNYHRRWVNVEAFTPATSGTQEVVGVLSERYPFPQGNEVIRFRVRYFNALNGAVIYTAIIEAGFVVFSPIVGINLAWNGSKYNLYITFENGSTVVPSGQVVDIGLTSNLDLPVSENLPELDYSVSFEINAGSTVNPWSTGINNPSTGTYRAIRVRTRTVSSSVIDSYYYLAFTRH